MGLKKTVDWEKAKSYFEKKEGEKIPAFRLNTKIDKLLKDFTLSGEFDINDDF